MSVLIKDMQMPEDEETVTLTICADGLVFEEFKEPGDVFHVVHVPPHGRLIDADALMKRMWEETDCMISVPATFVRDAPTIIPASEEGKT